MRKVILDFKSMDQMYNYDHKVWRTLGCAFPENGYHFFLLASTNNYNLKSILKKRLNGFNNI